VDDINEALIIVEKCRHGLPPVILRVFIHDSLDRFDGFVREYRARK